MSKPKRIPKQKPEFKTEVKKTFAPKNPKSFARNQKRFAKEIKLLIKDIHSVINEYKETTEFKLEGVDTVKGMIKHLIDVNLCYRVSDDEFEEVFTINAVGPEKQEVALD